MNITVQSASASPDLDRVGVVVIPSSSTGQIVILAGSVNGKDLGVLTGPNTCLPGCGGDIPGMSNGGGFASWMTASGPAPYVFTLTATDSGGATRTITVPVSQ